METALEQEVQRLRNIAEEVEYTVVVEQENINLLTTHGLGPAAFFPSSKEGIESAKAWLKRYEEENYGPDLELGW